MARKPSIVLACITLIVLSAPAAVAAERSPEEVCAMFPHAQAYRSQTGFYRAPAWHYSRPVTVRYIASSCEATSSSIDVNGVALVYKGGTYASSPVTKGFRFTLSWQTAQGERNWPIPWWACSHMRVDYHWRIADVYDFSLTSREGVWHATQRSLGKHRSASSVSISGCS
jgi:hypothetical protein